MNYELWIMNYELKSGDGWREKSNYELWIMNWRAGKSKKELWVMSYELKSGEGWRFNVKCKM